MPAAASAAEKTAVGLTPEDLARFNADGFLVFDDVFTPAEVEALRTVAESAKIRAEHQARDGYLEKTVHMLGLTGMDPAFMDLAKDPRIVERLKPLLGPDIQLQHSKLAAKPSTKNAGPFGWHQDFCYFPHSNYSLAAVMVMLDDATPDNGCMYMVKGSHKLGMLDHTNAEGLFTGSCRESRHWEEDPSKVVAITPRAGGISIHHCLTLHGSPANRSGRPRRGLVFQYRADDAFQFADGVWVDTGVLVSGRRRERVRCEAGVIRLPKTTRYAGNPYGDAWNQAGALVDRQAFLKS